MKATSIFSMVLAVLFASCGQHTSPHLTTTQGHPEVKTRTPGLDAQAPPQQQIETQQDGSVGLQGGNPFAVTNKKAPQYANPYPKGTYEYFVAQPSYPKTADVYKNKALLNQITATNSKIIICLPQQRGRLYVEGKVAYDWPVSTGTNGHETPTGAFRILEKQPNHKSNRYGKFINNNGRTVNTNADTAKGIPADCTFKPAAMPHWNRFTWDGVGLHGGKVIPGRRLSHGCIRTPYNVAAELYNYTVVGMPAYVTRAVEDYPRGGYVKPIDVKYRPGGDYTDMAQPTGKR